MKMQIYSALGALAISCDILRKENVSIESVCGHGGFFEAELVGQSAMSAAIGAPVTAMKNAGGGGAWGIAVLALFAYLGKTDLEEFLNGIFATAERSTVSANDEEKASFAAFMQNYKKVLQSKSLREKCFDA